MARRANDSNSRKNKEENCTKMVNGWHGGTRLRLANVTVGIAYCVIGAGAVTTERLHAHLIFR